MRFVFALLVLFAAASASGQGAQPKAEQTPATPAETSIHGYGDTEKACLEWNDGCRTCRRAEGAVSCSNIGIACQPSAIACTRRADPPNPPK